MDIDFPFCYKTLRHNTGCSGKRCPAGLRLERSRSLQRSDGKPLSLVGFQRLDRQFELLCLAHQLLRGAAELGTHDHSTINRYVV
jgi:hypothetical protein